MIISSDLLNIINLAFDSTFICLQLVLDQTVLNDKESEWRAYKNCISEIVRTVSRCLTRASASSEHSYAALRAIQREVRCREKKWREKWLCASWRTAGPAGLRNVSMNVSMDAFPMNIFTFTVLKILENNSELQNDWRTVGVARCVCCMKTGQQWATV